MDAEKIISELTFEEKAKLLTGAQSMNTYAVERLNIKSLNFADGPHGVRLEREKNCTHFPNLCNLGSSWNVENAEKMGSALADECIKNNISMLLGPGINIKRYMLCGRNFEYFSEDPVLSGEMAAGYIKGLQSKGVSASLKHFAVNNQEQYRSETSVEIDERTLREIYLKGFEIAVKKGKPDSVMCAYNKVNAIWCSENEYLQKTILKNEWGYDGMVVSDWGAVHDISRAVRGGLDLQMPGNPDIVEQLKKGIDDGKVTAKEIDTAVMNVLKFTDRPEPTKTEYDRNRQHRIAREVAADGIVLMKNEESALPLTSKKYKRIGVVGEYAVSPLISGNGSAEVLQQNEYVDNTIDELKKLLPDSEIVYEEFYKKAQLSGGMLGPKTSKFHAVFDDCDIILLFMGTMQTEDTEHFDRRSGYMNSTYAMYVREALKTGKKVAVVLQCGGAVILEDWYKDVDSLLYMGFAGEAAGGAISDVLCGIVNPSGKLTETFPNRHRDDLEYPGDGLKVEYKERLDVGYRYYDKHTDEIIYPFGHGISYTRFEYKNIQVKMKGEDAEVEFVLKNIGDTDGAEVVQLYVGDLVSVAVRPPKELKRFEKIFIKAGEEKKVKFDLKKEDFAYYNVMLRQWTPENGVYRIFIGSSSQDIRLAANIAYECDMPYTTQQIGEPMIG